MNSLCWVLVSDNALPAGIEYDYWIYEEAVMAFRLWCKDYPLADFVLYQVEDYEGTRERWAKLEERLAEDD